MSVLSLSFVLKPGRAAAEFRLRSLGRVLLLLRVAYVRARVCLEDGAKLNTKARRCDAGKSILR
ncbi:MAG TPA: hypothetical protein VGB73_11065 [Pyrinomonadaceae bacterium]